MCERMTRDDIKHGQRWIIKPGDDPRRPHRYSGSVLTIDYIDDEIVRFSDGPPAFVGENQRDDRGPRAAGGTPAMTDTKPNDGVRSPPFPTAGGHQFYAVDGKRQWHYVNHAGTWQGCPAPPKADEVARLVEAAVTTETERG